MFLSVILFISELFIVEHKNKCAVRKGSWIPLFRMTCHCQSPCQSQITLRTVQTSNKLMWLSTNNNQQLQNTPPFCVHLFQKKSRRKKNKTKNRTINKPIVCLKQSDPVQLPLFASKGFSS